MTIVQSLLFFFLSVGIASAEALECRTLQDVYINTAEPLSSANASVTMHIEKIEVCLEPVAWQHYKTIGKPEAEAILSRVGWFLSEADIWESQ